MHKLNSVVSIGLLTVTALAGLPNLLSQAATAQTSVEYQSSTGKISQNKQNEEPVDKRPAGKRGGFCPLAPNVSDVSTQVWSDRPFFVWRGILGKFEVHPHQSKEVLWSQPVALGMLGVQHVPYAGKALQPGQTYDWVIFNLENKPVVSIPFKMMNSQERDRINKQLQSLNGELRDKRATAEEIALRRAQYFAQQNLWSDVWQEYFSVKNRPAALVELVRTIRTMAYQSCDKAPQLNSSPSS